MRKMSGIPLSATTTLQDVLYSVCIQGWEKHQTCTCTIIIFHLMLEDISLFSQQVFCLGSEDHWGPGPGGFREDEAGDEEE